MLAWVVIYRRHLQHSSPMSSSLRTLRLRVQLSTSPAPTPPGSLPIIALSPLGATLMDLPASVANKRLTARLSPSDATLTKTGGTSFKPDTFSLSWPRSPVPASHLPYALPSSVSRNLFVCHSCENCRVCANNSHSGTRPVCSPTPFPYPLSSFNSPPGGILWVAL